MRAKTILLYDYDELSNNAKERVKEWYLDDPFRSQELTESFKVTLLKRFFPQSELDVQWSLNSCQGDGVNVMGKLDLLDVVDCFETWGETELPDILNTYDPRGRFTAKELRRLRRYIGFDHQSVKMVDLPVNSRYSYCVAQCLDFADELAEDLEYWEWRDIDKKLVLRFQRETVRILRSLCREMEKLGYQFLYEVEEEEVSEICVANDWTFTENGKFMLA